MFFATLFWREPDLQIYNRAQWLQSSSGSVRGITIPPNISLSKVLQSPWAVARICIDYIYNK